MTTSKSYDCRTVPGWLDVIGTATNTSTVTVNHTRASRQGDYYRAEVSVPNSGAVWPSITNVAVLASGTNDYVTNWIGNVFVPKTPEAFDHDLDGNLTSDGRWLLTWDGENRLVSMTSHADGPSGSRLSLHFGYDAQSRRISKVVSNWTGSAWARQSDKRFVYEGWNLLAVLNASNHTVISSFMWGLDLSGSMQGAGGVGGLLAIAAADAGTHFAGFDGNGNLAVLVSASSGVITAHYEYDPFGRLLRTTGPLAALNPFRFSTKYTDEESSFNYYGYRFYNAIGGKWINRDPIEERGGFNLYAFVRNASCNFIDPVGHIPITSCYIFPAQCNGKTYNPWLECCCDGVIYSRAEADSGIVQWEWKDDLSSDYHVWLTWDGESVDSNALGTGDIINGNTIRPAAALSLPRFQRPKPTPKSIKLSPCKYDVAVYKQCLSDETQKYASSTGMATGQKCGDFLAKLLGICNEKAKRKCKTYY